MTGGRARLAALALVAASLVGAPARAQFFSPGPLAHPHAGFEGLDHCAKCHDEEKGLSAKRCLECHTELQGRVAKGAGFHGRLAPAKQQSCATCHPDHRGKDFEMIEWQDQGGGTRERFDHKKTGWPLAGAHGKARCEDCHQRAFIEEGLIRKLLEKHPKQTTFLGVATTCGSCHFDEHRGQLGRDCQKCHDEAAWKPTHGFDHAAAKFPLRGEHKKVACGKCHPTATDDAFVATAFPKPRAPTFLTMKPLEFKSCETCHDDPHKGSLGPACASCHQETGWKLIKTANGRDATFHDKTKFPLRGGHVGVDCRSCHGPFPGQPARFKGLPFAACTDCHADAHEGQLAAKPPAKVVACEGCHTVAAWLPPRFERERHADTKFPLEGAHGAVACRGCHPLDPTLPRRVAPVVMKTLKAERRPEVFSLAVLEPKKSPQACLGCHEDVHRGQLAAEGAKDNCATCHKTTSFSDLTFDHDKDSRFALTGKHAETPCAGCHKAERVGTGAAMVVRYKPLGLACGGCHADAHQGQFLVATAARDDAPARQARDCAACHPTSTFKKTLFDHNDPKFTSYALEGKHAKVACARCHPKVVVAPGVETVRYRPLPRACEGCHSDFHHGEFRGFEP
jgi:hypothetical protein